MAHTPIPGLVGLTGTARREVYMRMKAAERAIRREERRRLSPHAIIIRELKRAQLLPAPGTDGLSTDERRRVRNKLKAMRRAR